MNYRQCDKCGARSSPHIPRVRVGDELWCPMCAQNSRTAGYVGDVMPPLHRLAVPVSGMPKTAGIRVLAHDSGDGETIFHCPFCGSGQVIARSDGTVECEFCSTAFTVQVQPQMPAFPQTIDGMPQQVPGMPNGGQSANVPPGAGGPGMDPNADPDAVPGQEEDGSDNPFADDADAGGDDSGDDEDKPAFLKGSKLYRTAAGQVLTELQYMRHLALQAPGRRQAVLAQIRAENAAKA